jgi:hypothetical protein
MVFTSLVLALAGCGGFEMPEFLGREGSGNSTFVLGGEDMPLPIAIAPSRVTLEPALYGALLLVEGIAPTQGYHSAQLLVADNGMPDPAGLIRLEFVAVPPASVQNVGPEVTRELQAAHFVPVRMFRGLNGVQVSGAGTVQTFNLPK